MSEPKSLIRLSDYTKSAYEIPKTQLCFVFGESLEAPVVVHAKLQFEKKGKGDLILNGNNMSLKRITLDSRELKEGKDYSISPTHLTLFEKKLSDQFVLETEVEINPFENQALSGLYVSGSIWCTQCEPEGFRHITYFLDRPDVLSCFEVEIEAPKHFSHLLSNGNLKEKGERDGLSFTRWEDPFKKPCYLFALVVGTLLEAKDEFTTKEGNQISLHLYTEPQYEGQTAFALNALKRAMKWDEEVYQRVYDLERYMIVSVDSFNMGAMENKGLNIFNSACILAHPRRITDEEMDRIDSIVAHEYFHNWSGNRVTLRDWFQLSLKEGLTVFRDQSYSEDTVSQNAARLEQILTLKTVQFLEDSSPMAHPPRPSQFREIDNFYTATVYEKGAEIHRMMQTVLGKEVYLKGMNLYFERFDGCAITLEDMISVLEESSQKDLSGFLRWFSQKGTPVLEVVQSFERGVYTLSFKQLPPSVNPQGEPLPIPISYRLLSKKGEFLPLDDKLSVDGYQLLEDESLTLRFEGLDEKPIPSLLRGLSSPVSLKCDYSSQDLMHLVKHDNEGSVRYDAFSRLCVRALVYGKKEEHDLLLKGLNEHLEFLTHNLEDGVEVDGLMESLLLSPPPVTSLLEGLESYDIGLIQERREAFLENYTKASSVSIWKLFSLSNLRLKPVDFDAVVQNGASLSQKSLRALKHTALFLLTHAWKEGGQEETLQKLLQEEQGKATHMGDELSALQNRVFHTKDAGEALLAFESLWGEDLNLRRHWFSLQTSAPASTLQSIEKLMKHPNFSMKNPNLVRAVLGGFKRNIPLYHQEDGSGYRFLAQFILELDDRNPLLSSGLARSFSDFRKHQGKRGEAMKNVLEQLAKEAKSSALIEILESSLKG